LGFVFSLLSSVWPAQTHHLKITNNAFSLYIISNKNLPDTSPMLTHQHITLQQHPSYRINNQSTAQVSPTNHTTLPSAHYCQIPLGLSLPGPLGAFCFLLLCTGFPATSLPIPCHFPTHLCLPNHHDINTLSAHPLSTPFKILTPHTFHPLSLGTTNFAHLCIILCFITHHILNVNTHHSSISTNTATFPKKSISHAPVLTHAVTLYKQLCISPYC